MTKASDFVVHFPLTVTNIQTDNACQVCRTDCSQTSIHAQTHLHLSSDWLHKLVLTVSERLHLLEQQTSEISLYLPALVQLTYGTLLFQTLAHSWLVWLAPSSSPPVSLFSFLLIICYLLFTLIDSHSFSICSLWHSNRCGFFFTWGQLSLSLISIIWSGESVTWLNASKRLVILRETNFPLRWLLVKVAIVVARWHLSKYSRLPLSQTI